MEKVLILYSGGSDSRLLLELARKTNNVIGCLLVNYGQLHVKELEVAKNQIKVLNENSSNPINIHEVEISGLGIDSALTGDGERGRFEGVHSHHVPGRNSMFLSVAFSIAESKGYDKIWIGCDWSDRINLFPDCYQEFIVKMREVFKVAGVKPIELEAPLMGISKELVLNLLKSFNVDLKSLYSGYGEFS